MSTDAAEGRETRPFYLVCDESASMSGAPIAALNDAVPLLCQEIGANPAVADKIKLCIIGFSNEAEVVLPLSSIGTVTNLPVLAPRGGTSSGSAFRLPKDRIDADVTQLRANGDRIYRPVVFFVTGGLPTDSWETDFDALVNTRRPIILAFGIGGADAAVKGALRPARRSWPTAACRPPRPFRNLRPRSPRRSKRSAGSHPVPGSNCRPRSKCPASTSSTRKPSTHRLPPSDQAIDRRARPRPVSGPAGRAETDGLLRKGAPPAAPTLVGEFGTEAVAAVHRPTSPRRPYRNPRQQRRTPSAWQYSPTKFRAVATSSWRFGPSPPTMRPARAKRQVGAARRSRRAAAPQSEHQLGPASRFVFDWTDSAWRIRRLTSSSGMASARMSPFR